MLESHNSKPFICNDCSSRNLLGWGGRGSLKRPDFQPLPSRILVFVDQKDAFFKSPVLENYLKIISEPYFFGVLRTKSVIWNRFGNFQNTGASELFDN